MHIGQHRDGKQRSASGGSEEEENVSTQSDTSIHQIQHRRGSFLARMKLLVTRRQSHVGTEKAPPERSRSDSVALRHSRRRATMDNGIIAAPRRKLKNQHYSAATKGASEHFQVASKRPSPTRASGAHRQNGSNSSSNGQSNSQSSSHSNGNGNGNGNGHTNGAGIGPFTRRSTLDLCLSNTGGNGNGSSANGNGVYAHSTHARRSDHFGLHKSSSSSLGTMEMLSDEEYQRMQDGYQRTADEACKIGDLDTAIDVWYQSYYLADEQKDTLSNKTEILCTIVAYHLQCRNSLTRTVPNKEDPHMPPQTVDLDDHEQMERHRQHTEKAKDLVQRIKPAVVRAQWLSPCTQELVDFLQSTCQSHELALMAAKEASSTNDTMALLHFEVGKDKKTSRRHGETLQHYQKALEYLQLQPPVERDDMLLAQISHALVQEYISQEKYDLAYKMLKQQIHSTNSKHTKASVYCRIANEIHIPTDQYDLALECLQTALNLVSRSNSVDSLDEAFLNLDDEEDDPNQVSDTTLNTATRNREIIKLQLYQTKADVLFRLGRIEQAWDEYEKAYQYAMTTMSYPPNPAEVAKMLYKLGRICIKLRRIPTAIQYFEQELEVTQRTLGTSRHFSVSRIYHELATVHDRYQNDHRRALQCLQDAYEIENQLYTQCQHEIDECRQCSAIRYCPRHQQYFKDCIHQLHETKNSQGRIHYKLGNFEKALEASLQHTNALGGGSAVATAAGGDGADADVDNQ